MSILANHELPLFSLFRPIFTAATFVRAQLLGVAAILTHGRRGTLCPRLGETNGLFTSLEP